MNVYYFLFYCFFKFARACKVADAGFTAQLLLTACFFFNTAPLLTLATPKNVEFNTEKIWYASLPLILLGINYWILGKDGKKERIIEYYDNKFASTGIGWWRVALVLLYIAVSFYEQILLRDLFR